MKARDFRYVRPKSIQEACRILAESDGEAVPLAGGQSLLATLNLRLSAPKLLVDIGGLGELVGTSSSDGHVRLGALTRHRQLLELDIVRDEVPLLAQAATHIGHVAIRNRGTLGGSLAYADPAAELPACAVALGAILEIHGVDGQRIVRAEDFFKGMFETDLAAGELVVAVRFPVISSSVRIGFAELARRHGDFPLIGLSATATVHDGCIDTARFVYFGPVDRARVAHSVSSSMQGLQLPLPKSKSFRTEIERDLTPQDTTGLRADTKLHLATVLTRRVLEALSGEAGT